MVTGLTGVPGWQMETPYDPIIDLGDGDFIVLMRGWGAIDAVEIFPVGSAGNIEIKSLDLPNGHVEEFENINVRKGASNNFRSKVKSGMFLLDKCSNLKK